ncbi:hypothetical protein P7C70_g3531, partial [Phenoliferia sp. Uapishka_3]
MSYPPALTKRGSIALEISPERSPPPMSPRPRSSLTPGSSISSAQTVTSSPHQKYADAWTPDDATSDSMGLLGGNVKKSRRAHAPWWRIAIGGTLFLTGLAVGLEVTSRDTRHETLLEDTVDASANCNPYDQHGVLMVNETEPSENAWLPVGAPASCDHATDFFSLITKAQRDSDAPTLPAFAHNRTILMIGDSVDRGHIVDFCHFAHGALESITVGHELDIPYPPGEERPPKDLNNPFIVNGEWPDFEQSRPKVCHVGRYNLAIVSIFFYGFRPVDEFIVTREHYYPPAAAIDRFDHILLPLLEKTAARYNVPRIPHLVTISPTFWGLLRLSQEDDANREAAKGTGMDWDEAVKKYEPFRTMSKERMVLLEGRMREFLKHVAKAWRDPAMGLGEVQKRPKILWRALHHVKEHHEVPYTGVQAIDQIGRAVVSSLRREGRAAAGGHSTWGRWVRTWSGYASYAGEHPDETEARKAGLGERLKIDEWGSLMLGMEKYFRDDLHPMPLPGGYLWGNMVLQQLKMVVDEDPTE